MLPIDFRIGAMTPQTNENHGSRQGNAVVFKGEKYEWNSITKVVSPNY